MGTTVGVLAPAVEGGACAHTCTFAIAESMSGLAHLPGHLPPACGLL
jgi:hypothetical protein